MQAETAAGDGLRRILVIKLGALGDFVQALGPAAAIRRQHRAAHIVLLTTPPFVDLAAASGCFDEVWADDRAPVWRPDRWLDLVRRLRRGRFERVYDLQTSDRSGVYFRFMGGRRGGVEWCGIARGCSHPHANPERDRMHTVDRQAEQLAMAGIRDVPAADLSFLDADIARFGLSDPYMLLVPGGAAHRPAKRWPAESYAALAEAVAARGVQPVVLAGAADAALAAAIAATSPIGQSLAGETSLAEVATLARSALAAVGNDTGPMHIVAASGCSSLVLFSADSDPGLCAPRGRDVTVLRREDLAALSLEEVLAAMPRELC